MTTVQLEDVITEERDAFVILGTTYYIDDFKLTSKNYNPETRVQKQEFTAEHSSIHLIKVEIFQNDQVITDVSVIY